jgi:hypothetical protein
VRHGEDALRQGPPVEWRNAWVDRQECCGLCRILSANEPAHGLRNAGLPLASPMECRASPAKVRVNDRCAC